MSRSCNDVCDEVLRRLRALGFKLDESEDHEQIFDALARCVLQREPTESCITVCDRVIRKLKEAGVALPNDDKAHKKTLAALDKCVILPEGEVQVVVGLQGGLVEDAFAYSSGHLADAKQAKMDKQYGLERDGEGYVTTESNNQVITYLLTVDKERGD